MKPTPIYLLFALLVFSCAPLQKPQSAKTDTPNLGMLGKDDKLLLNKNFQQVGRPVFSTPIAISVNEVPFDRATYKKYREIKNGQGGKPAVEYVDSLAVKPKYYRLEIRDKIGLKTVLNAEGNTETLAYLTKDPSCKIVSGISFFAHPMEIDYGPNVKDIFLTTNQMGVLQLERIHKGRKEQISIPESEIFDYELTGFCWGEDIYGKPKIELLNDGGGCPEGTEKNARKLVDTDSFLKL